MNSPNSTTMPLPPAKGEASAGIALTKLSGHGDVEPVARNEPCGVGRADLRWLRITAELSQADDCRELARWR